MKANISYIDPMGQRLDSKFLFVHRIRVCETSEVFLNSLLTMKKGMACDGLCVGSFPNMF